MALLTGAALLLSASLGSGAQAQDKELRIGFIAPMTGLRPGRQGHGRRLPAVSRRAQGRARRRQGQAHRRRRSGQARRRRHQSARNLFSGQGAHDGRRRAGLDRLCAGARSAPRRRPSICLGSGGRRPHAARASKYPYFIRTGWTSSQPHPSVRPVGLRPGLQEDRRRRRRLRLRLRGGRRIPEDVRGLRRQDHPEDLAAAEHQGFRPLHPDHQGRRRRGASR